jgi:hypothetical protein
MTTPSRPLAAFPRLWTVVRFSASGSQAIVRPMTPQDLITPFPPASEAVPPALLPPVVRPHGLVWVTLLMLATAVAPWFTHAHELTLIVGWFALVSTWAFLARPDLYRSALLDPTDRAGVAFCLTLLLPLFIVVPFTIAGIFALAAIFALQFDQARAEGEVAALAQDPVQGRVSNLVDNGTALHQWQGQYRTLWMDVVTG